MISLLPLRVAHELADLADHVLNCNGRRENIIVRKIRYGNLHLPQGALFLLASCWPSLSILLF